MQTDNIFGASLSIKQCRNFGLNDQEVLLAAIKDIGLSRFRLMSYWDEIEKQPGKYDFEYLDRQIREIGKHGGEVTLCLGVRQPRWPESHWPDWTKDLNKKKRNAALLRFIKLTVNRYKDDPTISSWQLENEALLKDFGENGDFDRNRIKAEFDLVRKLDPTRPIVMTTSTSWGIPMRSPIPDIVGFSYYRIVHNKGKYRKSIYRPSIFKIRSLLINFIWRKPSFIHELQSEPWGPKNIWEMSDDEQAKSMNPEILKQNIQAAIDTKLYPIDMWGLEWWYWLKEQGKPEVWQRVKKYVRT